MCDVNTIVFFDSRAFHSFVAILFAKTHNLDMVTDGSEWTISVPTGTN